MGALLRTRVSTTRDCCVPGLSFALNKLERMAVRVLEIIFFLYFASHIPITLFIDLQALLPGHVYPQPVSVSPWGNRHIVISYNQPFCGYKRIHSLNLFSPPVQRSSEVVCRGVQRPHGAGSSGVVQVFYFLRGFISDPFLSHCSLCFSERSVKTKCACLKCVAFAVC